MVAVACCGVAMRAHSLMSCHEPQQVNPVAHAFPHPQIVIVAGNIAPTRWVAIVSLCRLVRMSRLVSLGNTIFMDAQRVRVAMCEDVASTMLVSAARRSNQQRGHDYATFAGKRSAST
jgi:hypothetical protein